MYHLPFQNSFNAIIMCSMAQATLVITWALCDICVILGTMTSWKKWIDFVKSKKIIHMKILRMTLHTTWIEFKFWNWISIHLIQKKELRCKLVQKILKILFMTLSYSILFIYKHRSERHLSISFWLKNQNKHISIIRKG